MKNTSSKKNKKEKSIFRTAGETIGTIGHEIAEGKDKLVEAAHAVAEKFSSGKKAIVKKTKKAIKKAAPRKAAVKKTAKKVIKKVVKKQ